MLLMKACVLHARLFFAFRKGPRLKGCFYCSTSSVCFKDKWYIDSENQCNDLVNYFLNRLVSAKIGQNCCNKRKKKGFTFCFANK